MRSCTELFDYRRTGFYSGLRRVARLGKSETKEMQTKIRPGEHRKFDLRQLIRSGVYVGQGVIVWRNNILTCNALSHLLTGEYSSSCYFLVIEPLQARGGLAICQQKG